MYDDPAVEPEFDCVLGSAIGAGALGVGPADGAASGAGVGSDSGVALGLGAFPCRATRGAVTTKVSSSGLVGFCCALSSVLHGAMECVPPNSAFPAISAAVRHRRPAANPALRR